MRRHASIGNVRGNSSEINLSRKAGRLPRGGSWPTNHRLAIFLRATVIAVFALAVLSQSAVKTRQVHAAAPTISGVAYLLNVGPTDVSITWSTLDEQSDTYVDYGTTTDYGQVYYYAPPGTYHGANLLGLTPSTTYHFRIRATGSISGNVTYSDDYAFTTLDPRPPTISAVDYISNIHVTDATITWQTQDEVSDTHVDWGTTTNYGQIYNDSSSNTSHQVVLSGLAANTLYHFRIRATGNTSGNVNWSVDYSFSTKAPTGPIISAVAYLPNVGVRDVGISWQTLNEQSDSYIDYGTTISYGQVFNYPSPGIYHGATLSSLTPSTTYHFRIRATGATSGIVTYSDDYSFTTKPSASPTITSVSYLSNVGETDAGITWSTLDEESDSYVDYGTTTSYGLVYNYPSPSNYHGATFLHLSPRTTYHFRIKATGTTAGNVTYSDDYSFTTKAPTAPVISAVAYLPNVGVTDISITWSTLNEESDNYVDYGTTTNYGQVYNYPSPSTYHGATLTGLTPSTTYHFRIKATGATSGQVSYSDDYLFTTLDPPPPPPPPRDPLYQQNLQRAQAVALAPSDRPKQFIISDLIIGPATPVQPLVNPQTLDDAVQTLALLGINTPQIESFGQL
ncbi:MAG TPA: fibronectin type III domain-containing protein, partial [Blastocatellia bacterium]|nr:fibronectin type III domain-containing protein [Blastocatellia bacterium]